MPGSHSHYVRTQTVLDRILERKVQDLAEQQQRVSLADIRAQAEAMPPPRDMITALRRDTVALIAEVKHASPSRGVLIDPFDPVALGTTYAANGAAAISVLTDEPFFQGALAHLAAVRGAIPVPVLRKDFIIDPYQVYEGRAAGADAMLLIAAALKDTQLAGLHALITGLGMAALVEVHNARELDRVLAIKPALIGINNRDLHTFTVSLDTTVQLAGRVPDDVTLVAESGIFTGADVARMAQAGAHAVLVGEALVTAPDTAARVRELSTQPREVQP